MKAHTSGMIRASLIAFLACATLAAQADFTPPDKVKALETLKKSVEDASKAGKKIEVWLTILGALQKVDLVKADAKSITVKVQNNDFPQSWEKIAPEQIAGIGKNCVQGDAQRALALADYCMATEQRQKADEALDMAAQSSQSLGAALTDRMKYVKTMQGSAPAVNAASAAGVGAGNTSVASGGPSTPDLKPYAAPAKIDFKASEGGALAPVKDVAAAIDNAIEINLADMGIKAEKICDDPTFLRRVSLDLTGQIPTPEDVIEFLKTGGTDKRAKKIDEMLARKEYAEHWATFWTVLLVGRRTRDNPEVKISPIKGWLRGEFEKNTAFDKIVKDLFTATGENDKVGPVNYLTYHLEDTLPNTMAHLSQTFLGARIGCAQCHDHPFDKWSQADFWGFASFLANTRSDRRELKEDPADPNRVTRSWHVLTDQNERNGGGKYDPPQPELRVPPKALDGPVFTASAKASAAKKGGDLKAPAKMDAKMDSKMDAKMGSDKMSANGKMDAKMDGKMGMDAKMGMDGMMGMMGGANAAPNGELGLQYRYALAGWITDPKNEKFAQSAVNRTWRAMFGHGLVEPIDDIRPKNAPSHPEVMAILAADFNASGRDWKRMLAVISSTRAYQRASTGSSDKIDRSKSVRYAARADVRPMTPEMLFSAIIKATGGNEAANLLTDGLRSRDEAMMTGKMDGMNPQVNNFVGLMQRFINTSTAEDRAGKLQFEGTVAQALMMMHSDFMNDSIDKGVLRFQKKGQGEMVYIFAATLGRPPLPAEAGAFSKFSSGKDGLKGVMWVLLNSAEFVTIH